MIYVLLTIFSNGVKLLTTDSAAPILPQMAAGKNVSKKAKLRGNIIRNWISSAISFFTDRYIMISRPDIIKPIHKRNLIKIWCVTLLNALVNAISSLSTF